MGYRRSPVVLPAVFGLLSCAAVHAEDWPQFLGPSRNGSSSETNLIDRFPAEGPKVLWRRKVGSAFSGPVVVGNRLILFHDGGGRDLVECLDTETGKTLWKAEISSDFNGGMFRELGPRATPCVADGRVFTYGADSTLQCLDLHAGKAIWRRSLGKEYAIPPGFFGASPSPIVEGGLVLINLGSPKGAGLAAFDAKTGETVWTKTNDGASYSSPVAATIGDTRYALFFARTGLHGVEPTTGKERFFFHWRPRIDASVNAATPLVSGDQVFISTTYSKGAALLRIAGDRCEPVWTTTDVMDNHYNTCILHAGHLYGIDGRQEGGARLRCVELATGKPVWTKEGFGCASIILAKGRLYLLHENGSLIIAEASPQAYRELGRASVLSDTARAHPALSNGRFFARDTRELVCLDLRQ